MKMIDDLVREREIVEKKLENKDKVIQKSIKGKHEGKREEVNIETRFTKGHQIRSIKTRVNKIKWQLDIKNSEMRDIYVIR